MQSFIGPGSKRALDRPFGLPLATEKALSAADVGALPFFAYFRPSFHAMVRLKVRFHERTNPMTPTLRRIDRAAAAANQGFTLIEILLVVVIIGILAAVVVPNLGGKVGQAQSNAAKASVQAIVMAVDLYELDNGKYPDSLQNLINKGSEINWNGPYLKKSEIPKDPWGNEFQYTKQGSSYTITSAGPDGSFGSGDDISSKQ